MEGTTITEASESLVERYVDLWNEADPVQRRQTIEALWAPEGANFTQSMAFVGYEALQERVTRAYDDYVGSGEFRFRRVEPAVEHHRAIKVQWEMVRMATGVVASIGLELLLLDQAGRIVSDHQFLVSAAP